MEIKQIITGTAVGLFVGAVVGVNLAQPEVVEVEKIVYENKTIEVPVELIVEVEKIVNNTIEVPVNVTEIVEVDNGNLDLVLDHIYDNDGNIEYILDNLDDDEVDQIAGRVVTVNEFKKLAVDSIEEDLFDELDRNVFSVDVTFDEDDMERLRIDSDLDEIVVDYIDFDESDAVLIVTGTFEQDDIKYDYTADVVFKDGEYDELENITVLEN